MEDSRIVATDGGQSAGSQTARVVKRYSNRKLYDTVESRYVTLPQIAEYVRQGEDVRIIDNTTKEDLTRMTLAQILYEEERKQSRLPLGALKELLHSSSERILSAVRDTPVGKLIARGEAPHAAPESEAPHAAPEPPPPAAPPAAAAEPGRVEKFVEQSREAIDQWQHRVDHQMKSFWEGINPMAQIEALQAEVRRLNQRVEALEAERKGPDAPTDQGR
jgi:polyhydroxyalkanoate synthesis repressor PhaR